MRSLHIVSNRNLDSDIVDMGLLDVAEALAGNAEFESRYTPGEVADDMVNRSDIKEFQTSGYVEGSWSITLHKDIIDNSSLDEALAIIKNGQDMQIQNIQLLLHYMEDIIMWQI